ncbi:MAG: restriction endonuclease subunit S, partial [Candidatus Obscuribacterales bacterium]|nr:restriction endonuclease subunit S [Candidatus Obscuribacterales bacterium]
MMPEEKAIARKIVPRKALKKLERKIKPDENRMIRTIERPKKFKKDESGIINYSWPTKKLGDLFDIQLGKMLNESARKGELFPYLANFNVRWGSFDFSRLNKMSFSENERRKFSLRTGDLLMCEGGEIGRCAVWTSEDISIFYQKALHRLRPLNQNITSEFIYYYMQHIATKNELPKLVGETSIAHLTKEKLVCLLVPFPPLSEQKAITTLLSTWDLAIEKTERLIAAKEQRFNWLLRKLISKESVNEKWQQEKLGNIAEIRMGSSPSSRAYNEDGKGLPFLQGKADLNNRLSAPRVFTSEVTQECF